MPAPFAAGGPFVFCQGGAAGPFYLTLALHRAADDASAERGARSAHAEHGDHGAFSVRGVDGNPAARGLHDAHFVNAAGDGHGDTAEEHLAWEHCSFGAAFAQAAIAPVFDFSLLALEHTRAAREQLRLAATIIARPYWARGPPALTA